MILNVSLTMLPLPSIAYFSALILMCCMPLPRLPSAGLFFCVLAALLSVGSATDVLAISCHRHSAVDDDMDAYVEAKRHVADAEEQIARQRRLIATMLADGHDVTAAQSLLEVMETILRMMREHLHGVERMMGIR